MKYLNLDTKDAIAYIKNEILFQIQTPQKLKIQTIYT
ncbi:hypothetical protein EZS27_005760 [termite gut metagenome]|uniref:Uncharacterized protein n=1 Tax=termite gut metagenome TaxID=433724 RepID=A0A5J4SKW5_9ZZZZ